MSTIVALVLEVFLLLPLLDAAILSNPLPLQPSWKFPRIRIRWILQRLLRLLRLPQFLSLLGPLWFLLQFRHWLIALLLPLRQYISQAL